MEQLINYRFRVTFDDSDFENYFEHSWEAIHYASLNGGLVFDQDRGKVIADYRPEPWDYALYDG